MGGEHASHGDDSSAGFEKDSLTLTGAVAMGTGVMIGAGIFAITGQVAEQAGRFFPLAFLAAALISSFSAYTYVKMSNASPSSGGIASYLKDVYGKGTATAGFAVLMYLSMVINESLVARTFGTYTLQLFDVENTEILVPALGVGLLATAFLVNIAGNKFIGKLSLLTAFVKIAGIAAFAVAGLWASGISLESGSRSGANEFGIGGMLAGTALGILAYKGFTTITNSGDEIREPTKNVGRAIIASIAICTVVYLAVAWAVGSSLTVDEIIAARDFALAEAARPAFGELGRTLTIALAIVASISGVIASVFAVSRMLTMLTRMELVPHRHFGMPGDVHTHTIVYTVVAAMVLTALLDLGRIASIGAIFYLLMDMALHWGVLRNKATEIGARPWVLITALVLDGVVLAALAWTKGAHDAVVLYAAGAGLLLVFGGERLFLRWDDSATDQA